jgi:hypothetical protein
MAEIREPLAAVRRARMVWRLLVAPVVLVCLGMAEVPPEETEPVSWTVTNVVSVFAFLLVAVGILAWAVYTIRWRLAERKAQEEQAALLLEASVGSLLGNRGAGPTPGAAPGGHGEAADSPAAVAASGERPAAAELAAPRGTSLEAVQAMESVIDKLRAAGLFAGLEGSIYLSDGVSEGKIVGLNNKKTVVILPRFESAEFMARQLKRFDLCIVALPDEQACVIESVGSYIAGHFSL